MWFETIDWNKKYFACNNDWCNFCDKIEICERYKNRKNTEFDMEVRIEWQKVLDEIEKNLY